MTAIFRPPTGRRPPPGIVMRGGRPHLLLGCTVCTDDPGRAPDNGPCPSCGGSLMECLPLEEVEARLLQRVGKYLHVAFPVADQVHVDHLAEVLALAQGDEIHRRVERERAKRDRRGEGVPNVLNALAAALQEEWEVDVLVDKHTIQRPPETTSETMERLREAAKPPPLPPRPMFESRHRQAATAAEDLEAMKARLDALLAWHAHKPRRVGELEGSCEWNPWRGKRAAGEDLAHGLAEWISAKDERRLCRACVMLPAFRRRAKRPIAAAA